MKVFELAKEIGVPSSEILKLLKENEIECKNHMAVLKDDVIEMVKANYIKPVLETVSTENVTNKIKTDADYKPEEMIPCRSVYHGVLIFSGDHSHMTYTFNGPGDRRNIEYQDLKAGMLQQKSSMFNPDFIIEDLNLINDEHWLELKEVYDGMYDENDIQKVMSLPSRDFEAAFTQLPVTAKERIITAYATQMEKGTFEQWNKAKIIDKVCGTRFDLKL